MRQKKQTKTRLLTYAALSTLIAGLAGAVYAYTSSPKEVPIRELAAETHFHGIGVDPTNSSRIYLATHHGLYLLAPDGKARRLANTRDDFMGFTAHPTNASILFASGHPSSGGNLGFIKSEDGGRSWQKIANGVHGPVDFHQMDVSKADPKVIYGVYGDLQRSMDEGLTWMRVGPAPIGIIALAASSESPNILYAGTQTGLQRSGDGGRSWKAESDRTTTMVHVTRDGTIYAFVVGVGLMRATEKDLKWQVLGKGLGEDYILHLAADPADHERLYAITVNPRSRTSNVIASRDGGATWAGLGAH